MGSRRMTTSYAGGERTAEREYDLQRNGGGAEAPAEDAVTVAASARRPSGVVMGGSHHLFHTVSTSTPTDKRLALLRGRVDGRPLVAPLPPRRQDSLRRGGSHSGNTVEARSNQDQEQDDELPLDNDESCSGLQESKYDEQRAGETTLTRRMYKGRRKPSEASYASSNGSSLVFSAERTRVSGATNVREDILSRVATLKVLLDEGFLSQQEYDRRKHAIIDELTFASNNLSVRRSEVRTEQRRPITPQNGLPLIVPHVPNFRDLSPEVSTKHIFDFDERKWSTSQVYVTLDETPFSKGSLRVVYHLQDLNEVQFDGSYVAKVAIDPDEDPQTYFRDIELQAHCAHYADLYNSYHPPKRIEFLKAWVLELTERGGVLCAVEEYIMGDYRKHNNNFGSVSDDERNTPQAFSHFTYEASNHELLAVDIQGVGDKYTDPQIHTLNGHDFGKGNLGALGFQKFLSSHRCNSICRYLKLPQVNPKDRHADRGTLPLQELMNRDHVRPTRFDSKHYYEQSPMLQKYISHCRELEDEHHHGPLKRESGAKKAWKEHLCAGHSLCGCCIQ